MKRKVRVLLLAAVGMLLPTTMRAQCDGGTGITVSVSWTDEYGDGWNGGALQFYVGGEMVHQLSPGNGASGLDEFEVCEGSTVELRWQSGNFDYECDFVVSVFGTEVASGNGDSYSNNEVIATFLVGTPSCWPVTDLKATSEATSVTLTWADASNTGATYTVSYTDAAGNDIVQSGIADTTYTVDGLTPWTIYTFKVVANCSADEASAATSITKRTACAVNSCSIDIAIDWYYGYSSGGTIQLVQDGVVQESFGASVSEVAVCPVFPIAFNGNGAGGYNYATVTVTDGGGEQVFSGSATNSTFFTLEDPCPTCIKPNALALSDIDEQGAVLTWHPRSAESQWGIYIDGELVDVVGDTTYTFSGLNANTGYTLGVQSFCSDEDSSSIATIGLLTECGGATCDIRFELGTSYSYYNPWTSGGSLTLLVGGVEVGNVNTSGSVEVCGSSPISVRYNAAGGWSDGYGTVTIYDGADLQVYSTGNTGLEASAGIFATIESPCPTCIPVAGITVDDLQQEEFTVSWTPRSEASQFVVYLDGEEQDVVSDNEYTFGGLTNNTQYTVGIVSICSDDDSSAMATKSVRTLCGEMPIPYSVDWEDIPFNGAWPECWDSIIHYNTDPSANDVRNHTDGGHYSMYLHGENFIVSRAIPLDGDKISVSFWAWLNNSNRHIDAGVMTDPGDTSTFIPMVSITGISSGWNEYDFNTKDLDPSATYYAAWHSYGGNQQMGSVDDILIGEYTGCERPASAWIESSMTGVYEGTVAWNNVDVASGYVVYYNTVNEFSDLASLPSVSTTDTFAVLTGLEQNTTYYVSIATECGSQTADLRYAGYFTTQISCADVQNVKVENLTYVAAELSWSYNTSVGFATSGVQITVTDNTDTDAEPIVLNADEGATTILVTGLTAGHSYTASFRNYCQIVDADKTDTANAVNLNFATTSCSEMTSTGTMQYIPTNYYYGNSITQAIYTKDQLPPVSSISGISFRKSSTDNGGDRTIDLYVGMTDKSQFDNGSDWVDFSTLTKVAESYTFNASGSGWKTITFDEEYTLGEGNLVVAMVDNTNSWSQQGQWASISAQNQGLYAFQDNTNYDPSNPPNATRANSIPALSFITECEAPTCYAPMLHVTDVQQNSVTLEWYQIGTESQFVVRYRVANGNNTWNEEGSVSGTSYTYNTLAGNTNYEFRVGSVCGEDTLWSSITARTECAPMTVPYSDDFENDVNNQAPFCWTVGLPFNYSSDAIFPRVEGYGYNSNRSMRFYGAGPAMVATDVIPLTADEINVQFAARVSNNGNLIAGLMTDPYDYETFIPFDTLHNSNYEEFEYNSSNLVAAGLDVTKQYRLAFRYDNGYSYGSGDVDNVLIRHDDGCHRPTALVVEPDSLDVYTLNLSWVNDGNGTTALVSYRTTGNPTVVEVPMTSDTINYSLTGLQAATNYEVMVGIVCTEDTLWTKAVSVGTGCAPIALPYSEDFDAYPEDVLPNCWTVSSTSHTHYDGGLFFRSNNNHAPAVLPDFEAPLSKLQIEFDVKTGSLAENDGLLIGVADDDGNLLEWIDTLQSENFSRNAYQHVIYNFLEYYGEGTRIAFGQLRSWGEWMCMDNFYVIALEDCFPPDNVTAVSIQNPNSSLFAWSHLPGAYNEEWQVYVDTVTVDIEEVDESNFVTISDTFYTIPAGTLIGGGMYNLYVRAYCGEGIVSPWSTYKFGAGTIIMNKSSVPDTVNGCGNVIYDAGYTAGYQGVTNSALVLKASVPGKEVQIYGGLFGWGENQVTLTVYDGVGTNGTQLWQYSHYGTINDSTMADSILATSTEGALTFVFECPGASMTHWGYEIYTRCVDGKTCYRPDNLGVAAVSYDEATVYWEGNAVAYDVYYRAEGSNDWTKTSVADTFAVLTGLAATTDYTFYVQGICGNSDSSYESHPVTFRTRCAPIEVSTANPFFEGFESDFSDNECFSLYMPDADNTSTMITVASPVKEGSRSFRFAANGSATDYNQYLITPELSADSSLQVEFFVKAVNDNVAMRFGTSTTTYDIEDFTFETATTIASSAITDGEWTKITKIVPATTRFIAINFNSTSATAGYLYVDSLSVTVLADEVEPCFAPAITNTSASTNSITVNYSASGSVEYGITTGTEWDNTIVGVPVSTNPLVLPGLAVATTYTIGLRTNCGDNGYSEWVTTQVTTLETPCDLPTSLVADAITLTSATISWNGGTATTWEVRYGEVGTDDLTTETVMAPTIQLDELQPSTTYTVQVRAICSATNISDWSAGITFNTLSCEVPQSVAYSDVLMTSAKLDWSGAGNKWEIELSVSGSDEPTYITATSKPYTITGLELGTSYVARVRTVCDDKYYSDWSGSVNFTTASCETPTLVVITEISNTKATVDWSSSAAEWEIKLDNQIIKVTTHPYELTGLEKNTSYSVQVRALCDAEHTSEWSEPKGFTTTNVGIDDIDQNANITLFPNPASAFVTVSLDGIEGTAQVSIVDLNGRQCGSWNCASDQLTIDLSQFASGTYFVRIAGENGMAVRKLVVK